MFPNYKDFQIAVYYTLGKALPKHIEEVQTEIIENFDIKYNSPMLEHPLQRTPIYEKIILRILDTMEDLKEIHFSDDRTHVVLTGIGKQRLDEYGKEINQRLPFILRQKKFKRHTKEELEKAYRELKETFRLILHLLKIVDTTFSILVRALNPGRDTHRCTL